MKKQIEESKMTESFLYLHIMSCNHMHLSKFGFSIESDDQNSALDNVVEE